VGYFTLTVALNIFKSRAEMNRKRTVPLNIFKSRAEMNRKRRHSEENSAKDKYRSMAEQITK